MNIRQTQWWRKAVTEPGTRLMQCFFQPTEFRLYSEELPLRQRILMSIRISPLIMISTYPPAMILRIALCIANGQLYPDYFPNNVFSITASGLESFLFDGTWAALACSLLAGVFTALFSLRMGIATATALSFATCINNQNSSYNIVVLVFGISFGVIFGVSFNSIGAIKRDGLANTTLASFLGMLIGLIVGGISGIFGGYAAGALTGILGGPAWVNNDSIAGSVAGLGTGGMLACSVMALLGNHSSKTFIKLRERIDVGTRVGIATAGAIGATLGTIIGDVGIQKVGSGLIDGINTGLAEGSIVTLAFVLLYIIGYYRLPLYPVNALMMIRIYRSCINNRDLIFEYIHDSPLYLDECVFLHLPDLEKLLRLAAGINARATIDEIVFIVQERPQQIWAAEAIACEMVIKDLAARRKLREISQAQKYIRRLIMPELRSRNPKLKQLAIQLEAISEEANNYRRLNTGTQTNKIESHRALERMIESLEKIQTEHSLPGPEYEKALREIIERWQDLARVAQETLNIPGNQSITEINDPYAAGPVIRPTHGQVNPIFVGREGIVHRIKLALQHASYPIFFLTGAHRMGKSSLLEQLPVLLGAHYITVNCSLLLLGSEFQLSDFFQLLTESIVPELQKKGLSIPTTILSQNDPQTPITDAQIYYNFTLWLKQIEKQLEQYQFVLLLMFDEIEKLNGYSRKGFQLESLLEWFRSINQLHMHIALLFCGVGSIQHAGSLWIENIRNVEHLQVSFLSTNAAQKLMRVPASPRTNTTIFPVEIEKKIMEITHHHPYLIQALCSLIIENLNEQQRDQANQQDLLIAQNQLFERYAIYFWDIWQGCTAEQQRCLLSLYSGEHLTINDLANESSIAPNKVAGVMNHLVKHDVVINTRNSYQLAVPLFTDWLKTERYRSFEYDIDDDDEYNTDGDLTYDNDDDEYDDVESNDKYNIDDNPEYDHIDQGRQEQRAENDIYLSFWNDNK